MAKPEPRPPTPYERFVAATKAILSVSKKDIDKEMRSWKKQKQRARRKNR